MRSAGTAAEAYAVDFNHYPAAAATVTLPSGFSTTIPTTTFGGPGSGFNKQVSPTYIRLLPIFDGWSSYYSYGTGTSNQQHYVIASSGKDGAFATFVGGETTTFNSDIVFADGQFLQYPAGAQN
jgi:hypothetical protein